MGGRSQFLGLKTAGALEATVERRGGGIWAFCNLEKFGVMGTQSSKGPGGQCGGLSPSHGASVDKHSGLEASGNGLGVGWDCPVLGTGDSPEGSC